MIQEKKEMTEEGTSKLFKDQLQQNTKFIESNPTNQFFIQMQAFYFELKEKDIKIKEQESTIHILMQNQTGGNDSFIMLKKQLQRSEIRYAKQMNKFEEKESIISLLRDKISDLSDENEALQNKCKSLTALIKELESINRQLQRKVSIIEKSFNSSNVSEEDISQNCLRIHELFQTFETKLPEQEGEENGDNKKNILDLQKSMCRSKLMQQIQQPKNKSFLRSQTFNKNSTNSNHNKTSRSNSPIPRSQTASQIAFRMHESSDEIKNMVNLKLHSKHLRLQDCGIYSMDITQDSQYIALSLAKGGIEIADPLQFKSKKQISQNNSLSLVESLKFSQNGTILVSGGYDKILSVYKQNEDVYSIQSKLQGFKDSIRSVQFERDGYQNNVICGCQDQTLSIWDINTSKEKYCINTGSKVNSVESIRSHTVISGHTDGSIRIYNTSSGSKSAESIIRLNESITQIQLSSNKEYILTADQLGTTLNYIDIRTMNVLHQLQSNNYVNNSIYNKPTLAFNDTFVIAGNYNGQLYAWSLNKPKKPGIIEEITDSQIHQIVCSSDQQELIVVDSIGDLFVWKKSTF